MTSVAEFGEDWSVILGLGGLAEGFWLRGFLILESEWKDKRVGNKGVGNKRVGNKRVGKRQTYN